jgi:hypothetical protein
MATVYLGRDNRIRLQLMQDGAVVSPNIVTRAALHVPGDAFATGVGVTYDTDGPMLGLSDSNTVVVAQLGAAPIKPGKYTCYLTIYDMDSVGGLAWSEVEVSVKWWEI